MRASAASVSAAGGSVELSRYGDYSQRPDVAIVVYGEQPYAEFQGDRETLEFSPADKHDLLILRRLRAAHIPVVSVFLSGRHAVGQSRAQRLRRLRGGVAARQPRARGIADVLFRAADGSVTYDFSGRLSFSWPATAMPVRFEDATGKVRGALFARGYGLSYAHPAHVALLSEDPRIPPERRAHDTLYHAAHVTAPWSIYLADASAEVRLTTLQQQSPERGLTVSTSADGVSVRWNGSVPSLFRIAGRQADFRRRATDGTAIELRYRIDEPPSQTVLMGLRCMPAYQYHPVTQSDPARAQAAARRAAQCGTSHGALLDVTAPLQSAPSGRWQTLSYSLSCFSALGADLSNVEAPLAIATTGSLKLTIGEVRLVPARGAPHCGRS